MLGALVLALVAAADGPVLEAGVFAATPAALDPGQVLGGSAGGRTRVAGPLSLGVRGRVGRAVENDPTWVVAHTELQLSALAALVLPIGRGELSLAALAGGIAVHEQRTRHQALRLEAGGQATSSSAWAGGASFSIEAAVRLFVYEGWGLSIEGGPRFDLLSGVPEGAGRFGITVGLSLAYAIDGAT